MLRNARHRKILELIDEFEIETQEELSQKLREADYPVTQATISRDIHQLRLLKVAGITKHYRYAVADKLDDHLSAKMHCLFRACIEEIIPVGNLIILKTLNGNGANAGSVVDRLNYAEVVGTIAGVDTTLIVCKTPEMAQVVKGRLDRIARD